MTYTVNAKSRNVGSHDLSRCGLEPTLQTLHIKRCIIQPCAALGAARPGIEVLHLGCG